jgi:cell fate regulator YaaT (PSP1 superfamily)
MLDINAEAELPQDEEVNEPNFENQDNYQNDNEPDQEAPKEDNRFKDGDKIEMIRVRFPGNARSFPFLVGKRKFFYGQKVVAMSDRGMTVGYINSLVYEVTFNKTMLPIRSISKIASQEDIQAQIEFRASEKRAEVIAIRLIDKYQLDMILTHIEFTQFGKKAVFYFNAPARVDFRELVKDLVYDLKMRIELRQISVRDRAAALGSVGACGMQTCCSTFLKNYGNVSIKMAKNQNLALIPSKLNGVCGQIKCCIKYEDEVYTDKRKHLPREGQIVKTKNGDIGKVLKLNVLVEQFEMLTDRGAKRNYSATQFLGKDSEVKPDYHFPETFEHVVNETQTLIV